MDSTFIYALCEPGTRTIRYIGKTDAIDRRLKQHLQTSVRAKTHLGNWLRSLSAKPVLVSLHEVAENECWSEEERRYISCARALGIDLVNTTGGGEGGSGPKPPEQCAAISAALTGRPKSPEHRAAMSAAREGVPRGPYSPERCAARGAARRGRSQKPRSPEQRAALRASLSASRKGRTQKPRSPEHCAALSAALIGVPIKPRSPEHRAALGASLSAAKKGVPWSPERRAAHEARKAAK